MDFFRSVRDALLSFDWAKFIYSEQINYWAYGLASFSTFISLIHIFRHLKNYTMPQIQTYVVRILFICPIFATSSAMALALVQNGEYVLIVRDVYEAVVVYSFLNLILEYCGGETDCVYQIENEPLLKMPPPLCCLKPKPRDAKLMRFCCKGVLQFVLVKPVVAAVDIVLLPLELELEPVWQMIKLIIYNFSYGFALYCLLLFYLATKPIIKNFRPVYKFAAVKVVIFATYYQSLLVLYLTQSSGDNNNSNNSSHTGNRVSIEEANRWNNILLCAEMVFFSIGLIIAFPVSEFLGGIPDRRVIHNFKEVFTIKDVIENVRNNFMPKYRDYTLQRSQNETPVNTRVKTLFGANFKNSVAIEMTEVYRGKNRRSKFNSLLRGEQPITAKLRSSPCYHESGKGSGGCGMNSSRHSCKSNTGGERTGRSGSMSSVQSDGDNNSCNTEDISSTYMLPLRSNSNASVDSYNYYMNNNSSSSHSNNSRSGKGYYNNNSSNNSTHFNHNNHTNITDNNNDDDEESKINYHNNSFNNNTITRDSPPPVHHRLYSRGNHRIDNNRDNNDTNSGSRSRSRSHSQVRDRTANLNAQQNVQNDNSVDTSSAVVLNPMMIMSTASVLDANFTAHNKNSSTALATAAAALTNLNSNNVSSGDGSDQVLQKEIVTDTPQKIVLKLNHVVKKGKQQTLTHHTSPPQCIFSASSSLQQNDKITTAELTTSLAISREGEQILVDSNNNDNNINNNNSDPIATENEPQQQVQGNEENEEEELEWEDFKSYRRSSIKQQLSTQLQQSMPIASGTVSAGEDEAGIIKDESIMTNV